MTSILVAAIGSFSGLFSWLKIGPPAKGENNPAPPSANGRANDPAPTAIAKVDGSQPLREISIQAGGSNIVDLPKPLREDQTLGAAVVIGCPTNQSADKSRDVTYHLRGEYSDLTANARSYFTRSPHLRATLTVIGVYKQTDGTMVTRELDAKLAPATGELTAVAADVEKAEELIFRVRCDEPEGVLLVVDGQLARR